MFKRQNGEPNIQSYQKAASTALSNNSVVAFNGSGFLVAATSTTNPEAIAGVLQRAVLSTDNDYALNALCPVEVPAPRRDRFIADVGAGSVAQSMVGTRVDLNDALTVNVGGTSKLQVYIEEVLNTTGGSASMGQVVVTFPGINAA